MRTAWIAMGGNLGDRGAAFSAALAALRADPAIRPARGSAVYETDPVGPGPQEKYWNAVLEIGTDLGPRELLARCQRVEALLGRVRAERWGPRIIDLDILLFGEETVAGPELTVPHPRLHERAFVLRPLADLVPDRVVRGRTVADWLAGHPRDGIVRVRESLLSCR
ncbi:MAG: 2-amino-4-hydroxy-6-hydroxymethyldihydropteridine diphosphokinase [Puniceicoccaceae bacterium]